jgi:SAM-dependent methyltransferase
MTSLVAPDTVPTGGLTLVDTKGVIVVGWPVERWHEPADDLETALLRTVPDPVLDVGCGPGRMVAALAAAGRPALGVDPNPDAVAAARRRGAPVLARSVFGALPGEGRWGAVLLLDGNIGIGGDPRALLARAAQLLRPRGLVVAEVDPPGAPTGPIVARLETGSAVSAWFPWATVGADGFEAVAGAAGLKPVGIDCGQGRWFGRAVRP